jgi:hypothetical protein
MVCVGGNLYSVPDTTRYVSIKRSPVNAITCALESTGQGLELEASGLDARRKLTARGTTRNSSSKRAACWPGVGAAAVGGCNAAGGGAAVAGGAALAGGGALAALTFS